MKNLTLTTKDIGRLNSICDSIKDGIQIRVNDKIFLADFLTQIPSINDFLIEKVPFDQNFEIGLWDSSKIESNLKRWQKLFGNLPGWDYCPFCFAVDEDNPELLKENVVLVAWFAPSYSYNTIRSSKDRAYEVWLKDNGTAIFQLPTLADAEKYPVLYNFKGSWKEAYVLLIETLKKGWPMEEFPEQLLSLLKM